MMTDEEFPFLLFQLLTLLLIRNTVSKHPIQGDKLSVSNGNGRPLNTSSSLQSLISELKCRILFVGPSPRGLRQRGFQEHRRFKRGTANMAAPFRRFLTSHNGSSVNFLGDGTIFW